MRTRWLHRKSNHTKNKNKTVTKHVPAKWYATWGPTYDWFGTDPYRRSPNFDTADQAVLWICAQRNAWDTLAGVSHREQYIQSAPTVVHGSYATGYYIQWLDGNVYANLTCTVYRA